MLDKKGIERKMDEIIHRMIDPVKVDMVEPFPISNLDFTKWEWPQGVGLYGLWKLYLRTHDQAYLDLISGWFDKRIAEGLPEKNVNSMAPLLTYIHLYELDGRPDRLELCLEWAEWAMREMPRTRDGGLQHIVIGSRNEGQLWVDTLYMTVLFLAKTGMVAGRRDFVEEAIRQFLVHVKYLADRESGLWFHGWTFNGNNNFGRIHWGRGNCWFTASVVDFIEMIGLEGGVKRYLLDALRDQVDALLPLQDADGMWRTVLDDPSSYAESSATAGFGYGILKAVRLGFLPEGYRPAGLRACEAVLARVDGSGSVTQVSYGTPMGDNAEFYKRIAICPTAYGQALTVHLLDEAIKG
jgi:unsaturated rhamnogalacturonyl hydrolase